MKRSRDPAELAGHPTMISTDILYIKYLSSCNCCVVRSESLQPFFFFLAQNDAITIICIKLYKFLLNRIFICTFVLPAEFPLVSFMVPFYRFKTQTESIQCKFLRGRPQFDHTMNVLIKLLKRVSVCRRRIIKRSAHTFVVAIVIILRSNEICVFNEFFFFHFDTHLSMRFISHWKRNTTRFFKHNNYMSCET
jgi:hypothetical protein